MDIVFKGSPNFDSNRKPIDRIVIHWFGAGTLEGAHATFQKVGGTSAHFGVSDTTVWQWVMEDKVGYHAGNYAMNQRSIGIEHDANPNKPMSEASYQTSAQLIKELCIKYNIPLDRTHIIKHSEVPRSTQCPGTIDVDKLIRLAKGTPMTDTIVVQKADWEKVLANSITLDAVTDNLGVARNSKIEVINQKINETADRRYSEGYTEGYKKGKEEFPEIDMQSWKENGLKIEKTVGDTKFITNYEKRV